MPRGKLQLKLIENPTKRRSTYRKRIKGLKQKVYELSTLCGVDAFMISYGSSGDAETWPENRKEVEATIARYNSLSADARDRNKSDPFGKASTVDVPTAEALDVQLGKVRQRIALLRNESDLDMEYSFGEDTFTWLDYGEASVAGDASNLEGMLTIDESYRESTDDQFLSLPTTDTGIPKFSPELFLNSRINDNLEEASVEPYMELTDLFSLTPTDAGFPQLAPEPWPDVFDYHVGVVSDHYDQFSTPFVPNDVLQVQNPFEQFDDNLACVGDGFTQLSPEDCLDASDMMLFAPSGLNDEHHPELMWQDSFESFGSEWPVDAMGFDHQDCSADGLTNCSYAGLEDVVNQQCWSWSF